MRWPSLVDITAVIVGIIAHSDHTAHAFDLQKLLGEQGANGGPQRIAIIGAGSAGSSAAYYLRKHADTLSIPANISVFERSSYIGGRSTTVNVFSLPTEPVEVGGSVFVKVNRNLYSAVKDLGLPLKSAGKRESQDEEETLGVWNGEGFVFQQNSGGNYYWNVVKLIWRYGLAPVKTQRLMKATVGRFLRMYEAPNFPFSSLTNIAYEMGLLDATAVTGEDFLKANDIGTRFSRDIIQASTRVNYATNIGQIHGLEAMVCMATDGAMAVEGGNWRIFAGMLKASGADIHLNTSVTQVYRNEDKSYTLTLSSSAGQGEHRSTSALFDTVILAAPFQYSDLSVLPALPNRPDEIPYITLHVTLFTSSHRLSPRFFQLAKSKSAPDVILTTLPPGYVPRTSNLNDTVGPTGFWSISTLRQVTNPQSKRREYLYKVFSPAPLTESFMARLLDIPLSSKSTGGVFTGISEEDISWRHQKVWQSYPLLYPRITFEHLLLDADAEEGGEGGFWYTGGIESFISTMETSSLIGANVAALVARRWEEEQSVQERKTLKKPERQTETMEL